MLAIPLPCKYLLLFLILLLLKVLTIEKRIEIRPDTQFQTQVDTNTQFNTQQTYSPFGHQLGFHKFVDFGFYGNKAAHFGGHHRYAGVPTVYEQQPSLPSPLPPPPPPPPPPTIIETVVPQPPKVVYEKRVVPKVVYEKRIVPQVIVEKRIIPQPDIIQHTVQQSAVDTRPPVLSTTFTKEVPLFYSLFWVNIA